MKKMLAKAVVLGLVLGGIGFVANDAQAAKIGDGVKVFSGKKVEILGIYGCDVKTENELEKDTALANQNDLVNVNNDVEAAKTNIATNPIKITLIKMQKISLLTKMQSIKKEPIV